jgi:hypothetical protein
VSEWGTYIDRQIRKAIEDGEFDNLPGEGKPLNLEADEHVPEDKRMAYKILRDNDLAPDWILQGKELDSKVEDLLHRLSRAAQAYRTAMDSTEATAVTRTDASRGWQTVQLKLTTSAAKLNREITIYNLKVPAGVTHKQPLNIQREISRLMEGKV